MKLQEKRALRANSLKELKSLLEKNGNELFLLKLDKVRNKLKNTRSIFLKRKEIAQILTIIKEKDLPAGRQGL